MKPKALYPKALSNEIVSAFSGKDPQLIQVPETIVDVFGRLDYFLSEIEITGSVDEIDGIPYFRDYDGTYFDMCGNLQYIIDFFELGSERYGMVVRLDRLRRLVAKLHYGTPLFENEIAGCREDIAAMASQSMLIRISQWNDLRMTMTIRCELDAMTSKRDWRQTG